MLDFMNKLHIGFEFEFVHEESNRNWLRNKISRSVGINFDDPWSTLKDDITIDCDHDRCGHELTTQPEPFYKGIETLRKVFAWMEETNAETNWSTGFHFGISHADYPNARQFAEKLDHLKFALLVNSRQMVSDFDRVDNQWCPSEVARYFAWALRPDDRDRVNFYNYISRRCDDAINFGKIEGENAYIEIRGMGNKDYHRRGDLVKRWITHTGRSLLLALDDRRGERLATNRYHRFKKELC